MSKSIPTFFTGKQMESILFESKNLSPRNIDLIQFTKAFHNRLANANAEHITNERPVEHRRLDAMARLLVGDETCAAVAFDGNNLLIATNENTHSKDFIKMRICFLIEVAKGTTNLYELYPVIYISSNDAIPTRVLIDTPVTYYYNMKHKSLNLTYNSPKKIDATLTPAQHLLANIPDLEIGAYIKVREHIPFSTNEYNSMQHDLTIKGNSIIEIPTMFNIKTSLNSLQRRAEIIVDHLATVSLLASKNANMSESDLEKYSSITDNYRQNVLMNSLSWEASKWYKKAYNPREHVCSAKAGIDKFLAILNADFSKYCKIQNHQHKGSTDLVKNWFNKVIDKITSNEIETPEFILKNISSFIEKAERYFIDLTKLEAFFKDEIKEGSPLAKLFLNEGGPLKDKSFVKIIDDLEDGVHAEIRVLDYLLNNKLPVDYIATSILCCAHCKLFMDAYDIKNISGGHAKAYAKWILPNKFIQSNHILKTFLGSQLYEQFKVMQNTEVTIPHNNKKALKSEIALKIVQGIASLNSQSLKALGVDHLWNDKSLLADESDDEADEHGIQFLPPLDNVESPIIGTTESANYGDQ